MVASEAILRQELERERRSLERKQQSQAGSSSSRQGQRLRESQVEVENLERDINEQQELINNLVASEAVLRSKLERARTERAAYRMSLEKMQSDIQHLKKEAAAGALKLSHRYGYADNEALDTIVRASEGAQVRHKKELRGMMLQMEWMQARWEREVSLRSDAAYAKKFLQLQLNITHAWYVYTFPLPYQLTSKNNILLTDIIATKPSSANSNTSAPRSSKAASLSLSPNLLPSHHPVAPHRPSSRPSSSWPASLHEHASLPVTGPAKKPSAKSSARQSKRSDKSSARSSSKLSPLMSIRRVFPYVLRYNYPHM